MNVYLLLFQLFLLLLVFVFLVGPKLCLQYTFSFIIKIIPYGLHSEAVLSETLVTAPLYLDWSKLKNTVAVLALRT